MFRWIRNILLGITLGLAAFFFLGWSLFGDHSAALDFPSVMVIVFCSFSFLFWLLLLGQSAKFQRRRQATTILAYLDQAVRLNLPLSRMLIAAEASEPGSIARSIRKVRAHLDWGASIADSLRAAVPGTSRRTLALVGSSERVGRLGPELERLVKEQMHRPPRTAVEQSFLSTYPIMMTMVIVLIMSLITVFVFPKYIRIFEDYQVPLPYLTMMLIRLGDFMDEFSWLWFVVVAAVLMTVSSPFGWTFTGKLPWAGWAPFASIARSRHLADVCHVIGNSIDAGLPFDSAIRNACDLPIGRVLRSKLHRWSASVERGMPAGQAAHTARMPRLIAELMPTAEISSSVEVFRFLNRYYASRFSRLLILLHSAAVPAMVVAFGVIVALIALSLFLPMIALIGTVHPGPL